MKKRLFISSILMTLVLLVAITTATFAWYSASSNGSLSSRTDAYYVAHTSTSSVEVGSWTLKVTVTPSDEALELSNAQGQTWALSGGVPVQGDGEEDLIGGYSVSVAWSTESGDNTGITDAIKKSFNGTYTVLLEGQGNVVLLASDSSAADTNKDDSDNDGEKDGKHLVTFTISAENGNITVTGGGTGYYAIRTNNLTGAEFVTGSETGYNDEPLHTADKIAALATVTKQ